MCDTLDEESNPIASWGRSSGRTTSYDHTSSRCDTNVSLRAICYPDNNDNKVPNFHSF